MASQGIDIGGGCKWIGNDQEDSTNGHSVRESIQQKFNFGEMLYFERTFDFACPKMPTSLYFRVTLAVSRFMSFSSVACVRRTDHGAALVDARLVTHVRLHGFPRITASHSFPGLEAGKVVRDVFQDSIMEDTAFAFCRQGNLCFDFVLTVERCHGGQEGAEDPGSDYSSPRKRLRLQSSS